MAKKPVIINKDASLGQVPVWRGQLDGWKPEDMAGGPGGAAWGGITGTLSDQTDLQAELDGKEDTGVAAGLVTAHEAAGDPHTVYLTEAEADALYDALGAAAAEVAAHEAEPNPHPQYLSSQSNQAVSAANGSYTFQTLSFSNANGISFGTSAGSAITASHNGLTSQSNQAFSAAGGSSAFQTLGFSDNARASFTNTNGSVALAGINASLFALGNTTQNSSTVRDLSVLSLNGLGIVTVGFSNGSIQLSATQSNQAFSAAGGSSAFQTLGFSDNSNASWTNTNGSVALASLRASLFALGNTTQNSSSAMNLNVLSLNGLGIITAGFSNGSIQLSATQSNQAASASNGSFTFQTLNFSNANNVTFGTSAGGIITASVAPPGAAAEANEIQLLGANTAGNTTASGSTIGWSGINCTLSGTNGSQVVISVAPPGGGFTAQGYHPYDDLVQQVGQVGQGTLQFDPQVLPNLSFDRLGFVLQNTNSSNSSGSHTLSFWVGLYTRNVSTLSLSTSWLVSTALTHSGTAGSYSWYSGQRLLALTVPAVSIPENRYWIAFLSRTTSGGANGSYSNNMVSNINSVFTGLFGTASNASHQLRLGQGYYSATTSGLPASVAFSDIRGTNSLARRMPVIGFHSNTA